MTERARKAAGTKSFGDLVRRPGEAIRWLSGRPSRGPEGDHEDLREGRSLLVSAFARQQDLRMTRFRQGCLILQLTAPSPIIWRPYRAFRGYGSGTPLHPPFNVEEVGKVTGPGSFNVADERFRMLVVHAADQRWDLAVPTADVPLVRAALDAAGRSDVLSE
jgi:hypothetical protein